MTIRTGKNAYFACLVSLLALASTTGAAEAGKIVPFHFEGLGFKAAGTITVELNASPPDPNPSCGTPGNNPCRSDPPGAWRIIGASGTFSDGNVGIFDAAITGVVPISPTNEHDPVFDPLVPSSLSYLDAGLSYNNLFFPDGSPIDCNYPFFGTFLDVFGMALTIDGGRTINVWGDGNEGPGGALTYGAAVADGAVVLDYAFDGVDAGVPEPLTIALFGAGLAGMVAMGRRKRVS